MVRRVVAVLGLLVTAASALARSFVNFESGQVRPLALSPASDRLFAVNTPDDRLAIYTIGAGGLTLAAEVPVGLEPVALAARTNLSGATEVWVVNHLSDSVSIVEVDPADPTRSRVTRTLLVGDEPRDIVFAGSAHGRAFVTCARRGQNRFPADPAGGPQLTTPGVGRADVWVFDANDTSGTPLAFVQLFGDTPRALAASPDGSIVYAAVLDSGNQTTAITEEVVTANGGLPPPPPGSTSGAPNTGLIVKFDPTTGRWEDEIGRNWSPSVAFSLPDDDVFLLDADATPPAEVGVVSGVGTVLFSMAVRPTNGKLYVANTDARNEVRFEPMVRGHLAESRITVVSGTVATPHHLNPHIDYAVVPGPQSEIDRSLAFPMDMAFSADGQTVFVVAFGSAKVGVLQADDLEAGVITEAQIPVGRGPSGIVLDAARDRLYVMNRIDGTISIVANASNPATRALTGTVALRFDPSPAAVRDGRIFLYDARRSAHGDSACASCHIFGDFDGLAWDLGDPFGPVVSNPNPFRVPPPGGNPVFHPMKGPMTTQSLRGLADPAGPMHWRGDRTGGSDPGGDPLSEDQAFKKFNVAFFGLLGAASQLSASEMQAFTDFILTVRYPPNPIRALDGGLTATQAAGQNIFLNSPIDASVLQCAFCHRGPIGTDGFSSFESEPQEFKIAHLRNLYQKVGMFGVPPGAQAPATGFLGDQVRGFGFLHDGSVDTVFDFLHASVFNFGSNADTKRRQVEAFLLAFDTGLAPTVGQQVSATATTFTDPSVTGRINLMIARANAGDCDLVVKGIRDGQARGWLYQPASGEFQSDRASEPLLTEASLRAQAATVGQELTYTAVPSGSGTRIGIDRDEDGFFDRTELDAGSDPADPASVPGPVTTTTTTVTTSTTTPPPTTSSTTSTTTPTTATTTTTRPCHGRKCRR